MSDYTVLGVMLHTNHQLYLCQFVGAKILAVEANEAKQKGINSLEDYIRLNPGALEEVKEWFAEEEAHEGQNSVFNRGQEILCVEQAVELMQECHDDFQELEHDLKTNGVNLPIGSFGTGDQPVTPAL